MENITILNKKKRFNLKLSKKSIFRRFLTIIKSKINNELICLGWDWIGWRSTVFFQIIKLFKKSFRHYKLLPFEWLDLASGNKDILVNNKTFVSYGPRYIFKSSLNTAIVNYPIVCWRVDCNSIVTSSSSSIVFAKERILIERCGRENQDHFNYATGQIIWHGKNNALARFSPVILRFNKGIFFGGNGSNNYYHWMIEIVSKFMFLPSLPEKYSDFPLLLNIEVKNVSQFNEMIDIIKENREIVWMNPEQSYCIEEMVYIDSINNIPFNVFGKHKLAISDIVINFDSIMYIRKIFLEKFSKASSWGKLTPRKFFLYRRNCRRSYNQDDVKSLLEGFGFVSLDMEELGFLQQVELFSNAEWVVGPTGAALTNLIFGNNKLKCITWMSEEIGDFSGFSNLAALVGVDLGYITYHNQVEKTSSLYYSDYFLDLEKLKSALLLYGLNM